MAKVNPEEPAANRPSGTVAWKALVMLGNTKFSFAPTLSVGYYSRAVETAGWEIVFLQHLSVILTNQRL